MIYPINKMKIDAACFGNHDFVTSFFFFFLIGSEN